jgi:pyruvate dehydrogenase E2 component (dihydrolipoamide acetyltransferase)
MPDFLMPKLGADMSAGRLVSWRKKPGDSVQRGDVIAEVETDKADVEVEVFTSGVIEQLLVEPGVKVPVGTPLARLRTDGAEPVPAPEPVAEPAATPEPAPASAPPAPPAAVSLPPAMTGPEERLRISPAARARARELGVDPARVTGTGPEGRITLKDIERAAADRAALASAEDRHRVTPAGRKHAEALGVDWTRLSGSGTGGRVTGEDVEAAARGARPTAPSGAVDDRASRMRQAIAAAMGRSKREIPHYYLGTSIDMQRAMSWLAEENQRLPVPDRLIYGVLLLKAVALALREVPELNGFWIDDRPVRGEGIHVGLAISLRGGGLVAPALHHADRQSLDELMYGFRDLIQRARAGTLRSSEMSDPTITVTSLGEQGVETVFGVIYPPQVAIVGFGKVVERPWAVDGHLAAHPVMQATLAADHRVTDGHRGGLFLAAVNRLLQEPEKL